MKQELVRLLLEMFKSYGYETSEGTFCDIVGRRQDYEIWVKCDLDGDLNTLERFTQQSNGKNSLYITAKKVKGGEETVKRYAADTGVLIWDRETLVRNVGAFMVENLSRGTLENVVGNYCLESLLDQKKNFDPVSVFANSKNPSGSTMPEFYHPIDVEEGDSSDEESASFGDIFTMPEEQADLPPKGPKNEYIEAPLTPSKRQEPSQQQQPSSLESKFNVDKKATLGIRASKINMSLERAVASGKSTFGDVKDVILKFVPYWKYTYTLQVDRKVGNELIKMSAFGEGMYNAVNGTADEIELGEIGTQTEIPDIEYVLKQAKVTKEEVHKSILEKLRKEHTQEIKSNDTDSQSIIYQNKIFRPLDKDFDIKITQVYASIWEVQGKKDCLELNAYNSQPLSSPADDGAEFV